MKQVKEKEITEKVWFKRLSTTGIIIFSIGIPTYPVIYLIFDEDDGPISELLMVALCTPSAILNLILFFIIRFIFYRLSPMGEKIALPLIWITGLPGFIAFVLWSVFWFVLLFVLLFDVLFM